jgi:hypothetical protein
MEKAENLRLKGFAEAKLGREEWFRTVISGMEPRRIAVVMLLPRTGLLTLRSQGSGWYLFCQHRNAGKWLLRAAIGPLRDWKSKSATTSND